MASPPLLQPPSPPTPRPADPPSSVPLLLPVFILFFILMCFLSVFLFRDLLHYLSSNRRGTTTPAGPRPQPRNKAGLDPKILATFPKLPYAAVKGLHEGNSGGGECAVCLSEFTDDDIVRLLTVCCHAFHPACIDSWLASHKTCPMCRSDMETGPSEAALMALRRVVNGSGDSCTIDVAEDGNGRSRSAGRSVVENSTGETLRLG
ncbi:hypothetical protein HPP92_014520 [Vanilla planifolia]|uniref:RING-type E3 ubiquitin transferase n=2 Tax=Vanilla planifolia TaxID=51239 RepID=A0A835UT75_VANPL|nr:hypothetical protein HPP92_014520 [Vanilla planifolia]